MSADASMVEPVPKVQLSDDQVRATRGQGAARYDQARMASYLADATILIRTMHTPTDPIDRQPLSDPDLMTDGTHVWHAHLADIVAKHAPALPEAFVAAVEAQGYVSRDVAPERQAEILSGEQTRGIRIAQQIAAEREPRTRTRGSGRGASR